MMVVIQSHPVLLVLIAVCGLSDRAIGFGGPIVGRTKPVIFAVLGLAGCAFWMGMRPEAIAIFPLAFLAWRTPGWHFLGGSINPAPGKAIYTFLRHSLAFAFLVPAYLSGLHMAPVALALAAFALGATILAVINWATLAAMNWLVETLRGCWLGACLGAGFVIFQ